MKKTVYIIALSLSLLAIVSCGKVDTFHSGEAIFDGTTVWYLVNESDLSMRVTAPAEGAKPDATIYVKVMNAQNSAITETVVDSIITIPHDNTVKLHKGNNLLLLEKNGNKMGIGQFNL